MGIDAMTTIRNGAGEVLVRMVRTENGAPPDHGRMLIHTYNQTVSRRMLCAKFECPKNIAGEFAVYVATATHMFRGPGSDIDDFVYFVPNGEPSDTLYAYDIEINNKGHATLRVYVEEYLVYSGPLLEFDPDGEYYDDARKIEGEPVIKHGDTVVFEIEGQAWLPRKDDLGPGMFYVRVEYGDLVKHVSEMRPVRKWL